MATRQLQLWILIIHKAKNTFIQAMPPRSSGIRKVVFSDDDQYLAAATQRYRIDLWRQIEGQYVHYTRLYSNIPLNRYNFDSSLKFGRTPDNKLILVAGGREQVYAWQIGDAVKSLFILNASGPARFSSDGRYLFFNREERLAIWDWQKKKGIASDFIPEYLTISRDGSVLLTLDYEMGRTLIWDGRVLLPPEPAVSYDINRDGAMNILDLVAAASQFGQVGSNLSGDVNGDGKVDVPDLERIGVSLGESVAAPSLHFNRSVPTVSYRPLGVKRQFQALAALESLEVPSHETHIARNLLKAWLSRLDLPVTETKLLPNYPNPFNPETWIPYQLAESTHVQIRIYDVAGRLLRTLALGEQSTGTYFSRQRAAYWDGRNDMGESVSSGVYFYTLEAGDYQKTRRMTIVR